MRGHILSPEEREMFSAMLKQESVPISKTRMVVSLSFSEIAAITTSRYPQLSRTEAALLKQHWMKTCVFVGDIPDDAAPPEFTMMDVIQYVSETQEWFIDCETFETLQYIGSPTGTTLGELGVCADRYVIRVISEQVGRDEHSKYAYAMLPFAN